MNCCSQVHWVQCGLYYWYHCPQNAFPKDCIIVFRWDDVIINVICTDVGWLHCGRWFTIGFRFMRMAALTAYYSFFYNCDWLSFIHHCFLRTIVLTCYYKYESNHFGICCKYMLQMIFTFTIVEWYCIWKNMLVCDVIFQDHNLYLLWCNFGW